MEKKLNVDVVNAQLERLGFNQSTLANELNVSKEIVSKWLKNIYFPSPKHLLQLGKVLKLKFNELVLKDNSQEPVIAFRKAAGNKITDEHFSKARNMGMALETLVPYLPDPVLTRAPILKNPVYDYNYINQVVSSLRSRIGINAGPLGIRSIIDLLRIFNASIIPVLWGTKLNYKNAVHIYLPKVKPDNLWLLKVLY